MSFSDLLKSFRKCSGLTQEQLAKRANLSTMSVRRYESGERVPTLDALQSLAAALGVSPADLAASTADLVPLGNGESFYNPPIGDPWRVKTPAEIRQLRKDLLQAYDGLNTRGQTKAVELVQLLGEVKRYRRKTDEEGG